MTKKKKQEKKEEEKLEVRGKSKGDEIVVRFGDIYASLGILGSKINSISIMRHLPLVSNHLCVFEDGVEKLIAIFRKVVAIYDSLSVLHGGNND